MLMKSPVVSIFIFTLDSKEINNSQKSKTSSERLVISTDVIYASHNGLFGARWDREGNKCLNLHVFKVRKLATVV